MSKDRLKLMNKVKPEDPTSQKNCLCNFSSVRVGVASRSFRNLNLGIYLCRKASLVGNSSQPKEIFKIVIEVESQILY